MDAETMVKVQKYLKFLYEHGVVLVPKKLAGDIQMELTGLKVNYSYKTIGDIFHFEVKKWKKESVKFGK